MSVSRELAFQVSCQYSENERLSSLLDGHERAFRWFGGLTLSCLYDNPRDLVLGRRENKVLWYPQCEDFARYYGFTPHACQPYRARTKGQASYCTSLRTCGVSFG